MRLIISRSARRDLNAILHYITDYSPAAALKVVQRIERRCFSLTRHPERGLPLAGKPGARMRRLIEREYVIVYAVTEGGVTILRVLHGARDREAALNGSTVDET